MERINLILGAHVRAWRGNEQGFRQIMEATEDRERYHQFINQPQHPRAIDHPDHQKLNEAKW